LSPMVVSQGFPHALQNFAPSGLGAPQWMQTIGFPRHL
jgi:hypothetical protein